jgi:hypothetical protein
MIQIRQCMSELLTARSRGTYHGDRVTTRHDEVFHRQSFDILGAQRDSRVTSAEADVRVMVFCFGKLADFLNKVERASRKLWNRTVLWMRWVARRQLLILCWCARKHGCHTFRIDVEGQEYQRLVAWVSPLVHEGVRFVDQGTRSPRFCLAVDRVGPGAGDDKV